MRKMPMLLVTVIFLFIFSLVAYPQAVDNSTEETQEAHEEAIYSARFSPRWLIAYAQDLEARGYSASDCIKLIEAAKAISEVSKKEIMAELESETKSKMLHYADTMIKLTDDLLLYYRTGDTKMQELIQRDMEEVLSYEK
jgi:hypothetical protein